MMTTETRPPALSATVLLLRDAPSFEVLMVKRHHQIDFASGALVFPGGKIDPQDRDEAWAAHCLGWDDYGEDERVLRIAALREAYEESGILLARNGQGNHCSVGDRIAERRPAVAKGEHPFIEVVREADGRLDLGALSVFARWITPNIMPKRFDTWFFVAVAPSDQLAACDGWETVDAEWIGPNHALSLAAAGERTVIFPTRMNLKLLGESVSAADALSAAGARTLVTVEPRVEVRGGERFLVLPPDAGYGAVEEPLSSAL